MINVSVTHTAVAAATQSDGLLTNSRACVPGSMLLNVMTGMAIDGNEPVDSAPDDSPGTWTKVVFDGSNERNDGFKLAASVWRRAIANDDAVQIWHDIFDWGSWCSSLGIQVTNHEPSSPIRQVKVATAQAPDVDGAAGAVTFDQQPNPGNAIILVATTGNWGDVQPSDPPLIDFAYAGPDRPLRRIYQTTVEGHFNGLAVFTAPVVGDESKTLFVRQLGSKVTNWTLVAIEINAAGWRGLLPVDAWKGGSRPTHPVQAWDGFAYSGAPERDGPYLVFGEQFSDDYSGWDSVQVAPGGIPYNSGGENYGGSSSLRFENYLGRDAMHVKLSPGEAPISGLPTFRAEVAVPGGPAGLVHEGAERWISFDWRVAYDFPPVAPSDGWVLIHSMHHSGPTGTVPYQFTVDLNNIVRVENPATSTYLPFAPIEWFREKWRRITHHTFFSADDGWTEVYVDGAQMVPKTDMQTLRPDDATCYPKFGIYESENAVSVKEAGYANLRITAA